LVWFDNDCIRGRNQSIVDKVIMSENWRSDFFLIMMILLYSNKKARLENYLHLRKITLVEALEILSNNLLVGGLPFLYTTLSSNHFANLLALTQQAWVWRIYWLNFSSRPNCWASDKFHMDAWFILSTILLQIGLSICGCKVMSLFESGFVMGPTMHAKKKRTFFTTHAPPLLGLILSKF